MFHKITSARAFASHYIFASFSTGEIRLYDIAPLAARWPAFKALCDATLFESMKVDAGGYGVSWNDDLDLSADEIFESGDALDIVVREVHRVVEEVAVARRAACVSQEQLGKAAGLSQPAIARLEKCGSNPRLETLIKALAPLGKTLAVVDLDSAALLS